MNMLVFAYTPCYWLLTAPMPGNLHGDGGTTDASDGFLHSGTGRECGPDPFTVPGCKPRFRPFLVNTQTLPTTGSLLQRQTVPLFQGAGGRKIFLHPVCRANRRKLEHPFEKIPHRDFSRSPAPDSPNALKKKIWMGYQHKRTGEEANNVDLGNLPRCNLGELRPGCGRMVIDAKSFAWPCPDLGGSDLQIPCSVTWWTR